LRLFAHQWRHVAPSGVEFGVKESIRDYFAPNFTPIDAIDGKWAPQTENFTKISAYKRPVRAHPLFDFYQICTVCGQLHVRSAVKMWADSLQGFRNYVGLRLVVCALPQILVRPSGETMRRRQTCFRGARKVRTHSPNSKLW